MGFFVVTVSYAYTDNKSIETEYDWKSNSTLPMGYYAGSGEDKPWVACREGGSFSLQGLSQPNNTLDQDSL